MLALQSILYRFNFSDFLLKKMANPAKLANLKFAYLVLIVIIEGTKSQREVSYTPGIYS